MIFYMICCIYLLYFPFGDPLILDIGASQGPPGGRRPTRYRDDLGVVEILTPPVGVEAAVAVAVAVGVVAVAVAAVVHPGSETVRIQHGSKIDLKRYF